MKVKRVSQEHFDGDVYNFHCSPDENYYANGLLIHNCYKGNGGNQDTHNMTLNEFKVLLGKMPKALTQIAFGIMDIGTNPDFFPIMEYTREMGIIPNYTCHGLDVTDEYAKRTAELCGAVAVSLVDKEKSYDAIARFRDNGVKVVNIHYVISKERMANKEAPAVIADASSDPRLRDLHAIVFLSYKPKGRNKGMYTPIDTEDYKQLIEWCNARGVNYGFDSCACPTFYRAIEDHPQRDNVMMFAEPCESGLFSSYINCHGDFFPCSFTEGEGKWVEGISVLHCDDFLQDVWYKDRLKEWRGELIMSSLECNCPDKHLCRSCPSFDITTCKRSANENT